MVSTVFGQFLVCCSSTRGATGAQPVVKVGAHAPRIWWESAPLAPEIDCKRLSVSYSRNSRDIKLYACSLVLSLSWSYYWCSCFNGYRPNTTKAVLDCVYTVWLDPIIRKRTHYFCIVCYNDFSRYGIFRGALDTDRKISSRSSWGTESSSTPVLNMKKRSELLIDTVSKYWQRKRVCVIR